MKASKPGTNNVTLGEKPFVNSVTALRERPSIFDQVSYLQQAYEALELMLPPDENGTLILGQLNRLFDRLVDDLGQKGLLS